MVGNIVVVLVIFMVGNLFDCIGWCLFIIFGVLLLGLLVIGYFYVISECNMLLVFVMFILMWGVVYQGYNVVFFSFYFELFFICICVLVMVIL